MAKFDFDFVPSSGYADEEQVIQELKAMALVDCDATVDARVIQLDGPAHTPYVEVYGPRDEIEKFVLWYAKSSGMDSSDEIIQMLLELDE
jgi:hypothetical protein